MGSILLTVSEWFTSRYFFLNRKVCTNIKNRGGRIKNKDNAPIINCNVNEAIVIPNIIISSTITLYWSFSINE